MSELLDRVSLGRLHKSQLPFDKKSTLRHSNIPDAKRKISFQTEESNKPPGCVVMDNPLYIPKAPISKELPKKKILSLLTCSHKELRSAFDSVSESFDFLRKCNNKNFKNSRIALIKSESVLSSEASVSVLSSEASESVLSSEASESVLSSEASVSVLSSEASVSVLSSEELESVLSSEELESVLSSEELESVLSSEELTSVLSSEELESVLSSDKMDINYREFLKVSTTNPSGTRKVDIYLCPLKHIIDLDFLNKKQSKKMIERLPVIRETI